MLPLEGVASIHTILGEVLSNVSIVRAREIIDSRGNPTVEVDIALVVGINLVVDIDLE